MSDDEELGVILRSVRTIALVGASHKTHRDSYRVMAFLQDKGYRVIPVNPGRAGSLILGQQVMSSLAEIKEPIDMVDIFRNSEAAAPVVNEAIAVGARVVWMQLGVINELAAGKARKSGLRVVMDACPKQVIERLKMPPVGPPTRAA
jgi:predicted CoA-binding protein